MRPQHQHQNQNRRMRGGRTPRKSTNPLSRTYESNGPDVKVRGNAQHVAEKYVQLARDANASGDRVLAESYLQHAEHYCRLLVAAHTQTDSSGNNVGGNIASPDLDDYDELDGEPDRFTFVAPSSARTQPAEEPPVGTGAQPVYERSQNGESNHSQERTHQNSERQNQERQPRYNNSENGGGQNSQNNNNNPRFGRRDRFGRRERYQGGTDQEQPRDGQGQPREAQPRESQPRDTQQRDSSRGESRDNPQRNHAPQPEVSDDFAPDQATVNTHNDEQRREGGRRDRFGRNRFERPQRHQHSEQENNGQQKQQSENSHGDQPVSHEGNHAHQSQQPTRVVEQPATQTSQKSEHVQEAPKETAKEKSNFIADDGLPAFLKQPVRIASPEIEKADDTDAPVKRGRGRPRKAAAEDVIE